MHKRFRMLPYRSPESDDSGNLGGADTIVELESKTKEKVKEPTTDFEKAYVGMQRKYDALFAKYRKLESAYELIENEKADVQVSLDQKIAEMKKVSDSTGSVQQQLEALQKSLDSKEKELSRTTIVMKEYPDLVDMIDTLPKDEDEETLRATLTNWKTTIDAKVEAELQNRLKGTSINDSSGFGTDDVFATETAETLYDRLSQFQGNRSSKEEVEYQKINAAYLAKVRKAQE